MTGVPRSNMAGGPLVVLRGGGDLGTGVAHALATRGFEVVVLETEHPTVVRRTVAFAEAVRAGAATVEGLTARLVPRGGVPARPGEITVLVDPDGETLVALAPVAVVDARMAKRNLGTRRGDAELTIGLGPGFTAGRDVDLVIETVRGPSLGRIIESGSALPNTGVPSPVKGVVLERVLRSPGDGTFRSARAIGELVGEGDVVGTVDGTPVPSRIAGLLRGLLADGSAVRRGDKLGDVDPRGRAVDLHTMSDKARAVGAAVVEALAARGIAPGACPREGSAPGPRPEAENR
jgi:xanthine dehydrogenase accessory factor